MYNWTILNIVHAYIYIFNVHSVQVERE